MFQSFEVKVPSSSVVTERFYFIRSVGTCYVLFVSPSQYLTDGGLLNERMGLISEYLKYTPITI